MLLLKNPERSKQQIRRFPAASIEQAFLIRRARLFLLGGGDPRSLERSMAQRHVPARHLNVSSDKKV
jgi:hypothetical protein